MGKLGFADKQENSAKIRQMKVSCAWLKPPVHGFCYRIETARLWSRDRMDVANTTGRCWTARLYVSGYQDYTALNDEAAHP